MDSLRTTQMLTSREIKVLHLEPTDVCQAECPACGRTTDHDFNAAQQNHLTMEQILQHIDKDNIALLNKMFMCGNYGDPAAGRYTLDIYQDFRKINPNIVLGMNTNGAIRTPSWWQSLGHLFQGKKDYVVFSIDGLCDTNHIYRRGVIWDKLIENVRAYISTGASAHWDMLIYRHNEHQVEQCEQLAKDMGFTWFRAKVSKRKPTSGLEYPVNWVAPEKHSKKIDCAVLKEQSIYIDAQGRRSPCCWLGHRLKDFIQDIDQVMPTWQSDSPHPVCLAACGKDQGQSNFNAQWRREVALC